MNDTELLILLKDKRDHNLKYIRGTDQVLWKVTRRTSNLSHLDKESEHKSQSSHHRRGPSAPIANYTHLPV